MTTTVEEVKERIERLATGRRWTLRLTSRKSGVVLGTLIVDGAIWVESVAGDLEGAVVSLLTSASLKAAKES